MLLKTFFFSVKVNNAGNYKEQKNSLRMKAISQTEMSSLTIFFYREIYLFIHLLGNLMRVSQLGARRRYIQWVLVS